MPLYYESETIAGVANQRTYGTGITSTEAEKKRIKKVIITVSDRANNYVEFWIEREKIASIIDTTLPIYSDAFRIEIEFDVEIETGRTFTPALYCGSTPTSAYIVYCYEIVA